MSWLQGSSAPYAGQFPYPPTRTTWRCGTGAGPALGPSCAAWAGGVLLFLAASPLSGVSGRPWPGAPPTGSSDGSCSASNALALQCTGFVQRGSLSVYLVTTMSVVLVGQIAVLLADEPWIEYPPHGCGTTRPRPVSRC
ncbi:hypothetical protein LV779_27455 [Streptomyces thinghirensis]|nr:hypothetical protein [Streptomyces thinghirensis]